ncbi:MAG TPA: UDP-N-acetylmuramoyl-tripeptide--D-alanyl-D-alanine ligase [Vicinamibacterales bacterium]
MPEFWPWMPIVAAAQAFLTWCRVLGYLRYFQQEGYEHLRFLRWVNVRSLTDPAFWLAIVTAFLFLWAPTPALVLFVAGAVILGAGQPDPRRSGKVLLKLTWRATRVLTVAMVFALSAWIIVTSLYADAGLRAPLIAAAVLFAFLPLVLIAANLALAPYEHAVQRGYEAEAVARVAAVHPFIVGVTGSYGKSSTKAMLAHILQFDGPTLAATGSINTLMGITRHIREDLVVGHRYMVVEMGAFKTGSIRRLCQLTPPSAGLVTAVGDMHLERFGSLEEIVRAKSELAQAIPPGGWLVANADSKGALQIAKGATHCRVLLYGETSTEDLATRLENLSFSKQGTSFVLRTKERTYECFTPLLGRPIILNLAGAFTLANALGVDPEIAIAAMRTLKPVSNRLEVVEERGVTWIRDAYNSNQIGFRAALEVVAAIPAARRFLATPGVIELGSTQFDVNRALSREASLVCDNTLIVADTNREAFVAGHRDEGREARLVPVTNRTEAFRWLRETLKDGDAIILENDLPDLYERTAGVFWKADAAS